jgi:hypothetical protein
MLHASKMSNFAAAISRARDSALGCSAENLLAQVLC